jgi:threonine/homoserine/homoserine lactone efflux protein
MSFTAFVSAVLVMLVAPGPTNTLMGVAGAQRGLARVVRLLPAELLGYLTTILPLVCLGAQLLAQAPVAAAVLKAGAAAWVMVLAVRLWGLRGGGDARSDVTARNVYLTTMLNPKALIFGLVLMPAPGDATFLPKLGLFCVMVTGVALAWGTAGTLTQAGTGGSHRLRMVQRIASVWLALVSITLMAGVIRA